MFHQNRTMISLYSNIGTGSDTNHETYNKKLQILFYATNNKVA